MDIAQGHRPIEAPRYSQEVLEVQSDIDYWDTSIRKRWRKAILVNIKH